MKKIAWNTFFGIILFLGAMFCGGADYNNEMNWTQFLIGFGMIIFSGICICNQKNNKGEEE